jgi:hypothetical protein
LLSLIVPQRGPEKYVYISMGGSHLVDHGVIYRRLGIRNLFSFDKSERVVDRQLVNRPLDCVVCNVMSSGNLPTMLDGIVANFKNATNVIVWLDYTRPKDRLSQLQETVEIAKRLRPGDILRLTLNASIRTLDAGDHQTPGEYRCSRLHQQLGNFVPTDLRTIPDDKFPDVLCRCIELAIARAETEAPSVKIVPAFISTYRDGQRMVTVTCVAVDAASKEKLPILRKWKFKAKNWGHILSIDAPNLSTREKIRLDQEITRSAKKALKSLGFLPASNEEKSLAVVQSYQNLHRYYPSFYHVDT